MGSHILRIHSLYTSSYIFCIHTLYTSSYVLYKHPVCTRILSLPARTQSAQKFILSIYWVYTQVHSLCIYWVYTQIHSFYIYWVNTQVHSFSWSWAKARPWNQNSQREDNLSEQLATPCPETESEQIMSGKAKEGNGELLKKQQLTTCSGKEGGWGQKKNVIHDFMLATFKLWKTWK